MTTEIKIGHAIDILRSMPSESVDCIVTSPPYWGLRDYKTEPVVWDAEEGCEHQWGDEQRKKARPTRDSSGGFGGAGTRGQQGYSQSCSLDVSMGAFCQKCGAWRGQLGLETTPQLYIQHLIAIFDEVHRVLKKEGTCWVNLGDTYARGDRGSGGRSSSKLATHGTDNFQAFDRINTDCGSPNKCLVQIPSRFAIAMTDAGWILRNEIIWHKPNAMPSSVSDRFTVDFEKLFFFTKSRRYYFEPQYEDAVTPKGAVERINTAKRFGERGDTSSSANRGGRTYEYTGKRNKRCVWPISTRPYKGAHFAVFPPELVEIPIVAGCPIDGVVLDPFGGSGTVGAVAERMGRNSVLIELNPAYVPLIEERMGLDGTMGGATARPMAVEA